MNKLKTRMSKISKKSCDKTKMAKVQENTKAMTRKNKKMQRKFHTQSGQHQEH